MKYTKEDILRKRISFKPMSEQDLNRLNNHFGADLPYKEYHHYRLYRCSYSDTYLGFLINNGCQPDSYLGESNGEFEASHEIDISQFDFEEHYEEQFKFDLI